MSAGTTPRPSSATQPNQGFWLRLRALTRKEFRQMLRDRSNLALGVVLPMMLILLFGYGLSMDLKDAPVAVVLEDSSPAARDAVAGLQGSAFLKPVQMNTMAEAEAMMRARAVDAIVRVPVDFTQRREWGDAQIQLIVHGVDAATATSFQAYIMGALNLSQQRQADLQGASLQGPDAGSGPSIQVEQRLWFNAANTSTWYLVPGVIVLVMTLVGAFLTSLVIAREWERGTLEALFVTPVHALEILLSKVIPYFAVGLLGLAMCVVAARGMFHVPLQGSLWALLISSSLYLVVALGIGLLISAATRNQFIACQAALLVSFLPAMMLSGFIFDLRNVPTAVAWIARLLPATYFVELVKTSFLAGDDMTVMLRDWAVLLLQAAALLGLARTRIRKSLDR